MLIFNMLKWKKKNPKQVHSPFDESISVLFYITKIIVDFLVERNIPWLKILERYFPLPFLHEWVLFCDNIF